MSSFAAGLFEWEKRGRSKPAELHKVPVADRASLCPGPTHSEHLALSSALGLAGLESRSEPCVQRAHSPPSKLIRDWLDRHSLETPGPWNGRQNKMTQSEGH